MALGLPNYDQAARILQFNLDKSIRGNTYIEFETSVKAFGIRPGDLITVTYQKEGFTRQPFRVLKISPATNYRTARSQRKSTTTRGTPTPTGRATSAERHGAAGRTREWACRGRWWAAWWTPTA